MGQIWFDVATIMLFAGFAVVSGMLWPKMLNDRILDEAAQLQEAFPGIVRADYARVLDRPGQNSGYRGYVMPTLMFVVIVVIGACLIVLDTSDPTLFDGYEILYGVVTSDAEKHVQGARGFLMLQAAFLGAFLWSLQHLLRRAQARDISPATIYQICLYMLFGMVLSIFVNHASQDGSFGMAQFGMAQTLPVLGFFTGYFSVEMFDKVTEWVMRKKKAMPADEMPPSLAVIEGISYDTLVRLRELWLDDAYALANSNPLEISLKTPFGLESCIDWVAQAQLLLKVKAEPFQCLRRLGIRTILQLDTLLRTRDGDRSAFARLLDGATFTDAEAAARESLRAMDTHGAATLDKDLSFLRLRQLCELLYPTDTTRPPRLVIELPEREGVA